MPQSIAISKYISEQDRVKMVVVVSATRNLYSLKSDFSLDEIMQVKNPQQMQE
jgi:hypothetical protein